MLIHERIISFGVYVCVLFGKKCADIASMIVCAWGYINVAWTRSSIVSVWVSLLQVLQWIVSSDPMCGNWFPNSVFPSLNRVSVHVISLLMYLDCRFLRNCFMCLAVIVVSLSLERQLDGEFVFSRGFLLLSLFAVSSEISFSFF